MKLIIHYLILDILKLLTQIFNNIYNMNKFNLISLSILLIMILFTSCDYGVIKQSDLKVKLEEAYFEGQETAGDGYKVQYEDGYLSWSPKHVFERCYRELTPQEVGMVIEY